MENDSQVFGIYRAIEEGDATIVVVTEEMYCLNGPKKCIV